MEMNDQTSDEVCAQIARGIQGLNSGSTSLSPCYKFKKFRVFFGRRVGISNIQNTFDIYNNLGKNMHGRN
jgi:hypothetical protein